MRVWWAGGGSGGWGGGAALRVGIEREELG